MEQTSPPVQQAAPLPHPRAKTALLSVFEYVEVLAFCLLTILLIYGLGIRICSVSGDSMNPTLENGQRLFVSNLNYEPTNGDIVVFHQISDLDPRYNEPIIKRVIATEGQHLVIDFHNATVTVDGVLLQEDYIRLSGDRYTVRGEHHTENGILDVIVPEGCLFVMGDNRNESLDSRSRVIGFVDERRLLGRVIVRLTPTALFGEVD